MKKIHITLFKTCLLINFYEFHVYIYFIQSLYSPLYTFLRTYIYINFNKKCILVYIPTLSYFFFDTRGKHPHLSLKLGTCTDVECIGKVNNIVPSPCVGFDSEISRNKNLSQGTRYQ